MQQLPREILQEDIEYIQSGGTSTVFKAIDNKTGEKVVLKVIPKEKTILEEFLNEVKILERFKDDCDPYLLCFKRAFESSYKEEPVYVLVTDDLSDYEELFSIVSRKPYSENKKFYQEVIENIFKGFLVMTEKQVVHRDIKLENILVNEETGAIKFIDYGGACSGKSCENKGSHTLTYVPPEYFGKWKESGLTIVKQIGKFRFQLSNDRIYKFTDIRVVGDEKAPLNVGEIVASREYDDDYEPRKADIWALACTMWAIINGNLRPNDVYGKQLTGQNIDYYFKTYPFFPTIDKKDTVEEKKRKVRAYERDMKMVKELLDFKVVFPMKDTQEISNRVEEIFVNPFSMFQDDPKKRNIGLLKRNETTLQNPKRSTKTIL